MYEQKVSMGYKKTAEDPDGRVTQKKRDATGIFDPRNRARKFTDYLGCDKEIIREKGLCIGLKVRCADGVIRTIRLVRDGDVFVEGIKGRVNPRTLTLASR